MLRHEFNDVYMYQMNNDIPYGKLIYILNLNQKYTTYLLIEWDLATKQRKILKTFDLGYHFLYLSSEVVIYEFHDNIYIDFFRKANFEPILVPIEKNIAITFDSKTHAIITGQGRRICLWELSTSNSYQMKTENQLPQELLKMYSSAAFV